MKLRKTPNQRRRQVLIYLFACAAPIAAAGCSAPGGAIGASAARESPAPGSAVRGLGNKCLDDSGGGTDPGNKIQLWDCNGTVAQQWTLDQGRLVGPGGKCLDVQWGNQSDGAIVQLWDCNGTAAQQWTINGGAIVSAGGLCLDVKGYGTDNGTQIELWHCTGGANQTWSFASPGGPGTPGKGAAGVLSYLQSIVGKRTISGQFVEAGPIDPINAIAESTGKWLGLIGLDYFHYNVPGLAILDGNAVAEQYAKAGGLITLSTSMPNPTSRNGLADTSYVPADQILVPGNPTHDQFMATLDSIAVGLQQLDSAGVVVIYRPFHELTGNWFWWGRQNFNAAQFRAMWQFVHDYFTKTKGLTNLLWLYAPANTNDPSNNTVVSYYPGNEYVDVVGMDLYSDDPARDGASMYATLNGFGKPIFLAEFGAGQPAYGNTNFSELTLVDAIKRTMPNVVAWQQWWDGNAGNVGWGMAETRDVAAALSDPRVLNRGDMQ
ncbi:MAG: glycoside hydrolase [Myxococcales bacterium]|nr:glycoside hydrolase [Myxococcales bacterium]